MKHLLERDFPSSRGQTTRRLRFGVRRQPVLTKRRAAVERCSPSGSRLLLELASQVGIQPSYVDMAGKRQDASPETLKAILQLWGISASTSREAEEALREHNQRHWRRALEPVLVAWDGKPAKIELRLPADREMGSVRCLLRFEDGHCKSLEARPGRLRTVREVQVEDRKFVVKQLALPALPLGYHQLEIELRGRIDSALLISAPVQSYSPPGAPRRWGIFLPMYAAHSAQSWGAGNLGDWRELSEWVASLGGTMVSTLPLLAAFLDCPFCEPSPYSPASRLFWNEFYLDIERAPEFKACRPAQRLFRSTAFQQKLSSFRQEPLVDYRAQMAARRQVLEQLAAFFQVTPSARQRDYQRFLSEHPNATDYAEFRATCERTNTAWHRWDQRLRFGKLQPGDFSSKVRDYHLYVQWLAQEQMAAFMEQCRTRSTQFHLDLPLGVHPDGYDLWRERDSFAFPASVGAPPDMFFTKGQNWGFAPLHPQRIRERGYPYVLDYLRFQMRHTGLLRIDHIMGLHRLYWIPPGFPATEGAYVSYPAEELHAILSLESHRNHTVLVGENLGTVPPEVNAAMARHGIRQTYVVQYEQRPNPRQPLRPPPTQAVAAINTHDMPTFAAHWRGLDIEDRSKLGLIPKPKLREEHERRRQINSALVSFLKRKGGLKAEEPDEAAVLRACLAWLASGPAEILQVNLEDLWAETEPQNVPGTSTERPNWRRKARLTLEQILGSDQLRQILSDMTRLRHSASSRK